MEELKADSIDRIPRAEGRLKRLQEWSILLTESQGSNVGSTHDHVCSNITFPRTQRGVERVPAASLQ